MAKSKNKVNKSSKATKVSTRTKISSPKAEERPANNGSIVNRVVILVLVLLGLYLLVSLFLGWRDQQNGDGATDNNQTSQVEGREDSGDAGSDEDNDAEDSDQSNQSAGANSGETDTEYRYTVAEGESYTSLARRAVASIDSNLTPAERVAAETKLTAEANADYLNAGQSLVFAKDTVREAVDWAKSLSDEQKAAWQPYADLVVWPSVK